MLFLQSFLLALSISDTFADTATLKSFALREAESSTSTSAGSSLVVSEPEPERLFKRARPPRTRYLYAIPSTNAEVCIGTWAYASCVVTLSLTTANWVKSQVTDASAAVPQAKRDEDAITWGQLYNSSVTSGKNTVTGVEAAALVGAVTSSPSFADMEIAFPSSLDPKSEKGLAAAADLTASSQYIATAMEIHEDGFSASFAPDVSGSLDRRASCNEQVHIHYWAAAGHTSTVLGTSDIQNLVRTALDNSYFMNYQAACYELDNNRAWSGAFRVCYNANQTKAGCFQCNGYNN